MANKIIEYYGKNVYGNTLFYIKDKEIAEAVRILTGQKTITPRDGEGLKMLGFELKQVMPPTTAVASL